MKIRGFERPIAKWIMLHLLWTAIYLAIMGAIVGAIGGVVTIGIGLFLG